MSLTSVLSGKTERDIEFQKIIREIIPDKSDFYTQSGHSPFSNEYEILAPYNLTNTYYSSVVGTAFDYLARIIIAKKLTQKKQSYTALYAENGLFYIKKFVDNKTYTTLQNRYTNGINSFKNYTLGKSSLEETLQYACYFAKLEHIARSGLPPKDIKISLLEPTVKEVIDDLSKACEIFIDKFILSINITSKSDVIFNPTFGGLISMCCQSDADIYIDGTIYDFKTTKSFGYKWQNIAQITCYYLFYLLAIALNDYNSSLNFKVVNRIAFYKARSGECEYLNISSLGKDKIISAVKSLLEYWNFTADPYFFVRFENSLYVD